MFSVREESAGSQEGREIATGGGEKYQFPPQASGSDVSSSASDAAVGGKASLQPRRTPVTEREIEAVMVLGGCF
ncbi:unnamed protein product [Linum tenue]|uniref:Uncharacterized protein n=1 Tax=Linum tenue TaxID=586396 RepID=A0AAV0MUZ6_9ROSI|nr:unnamed protein product [Linum tenue]